MVCCDLPEGSLKIGPMSECESWVVEFGSTLYHCMNLRIHIDAYCTDLGSINIKIHPGVRTNVLIAGVANVEFMRMTKCFYPTVL